MARSMNWDKARRDTTLAYRRATEEPLYAKKPPGGVTYKQAKLLAKLQRQLREPYGGAGLSRAEASVLIDDCLTRLRGSTSVS